jgi:hypothetical protein
VKSTYYSVLAQSQFGSQGDVGVLTLGLLSLLFPSLACAPASSWNSCRFFSHILLDLLLDAVGCARGGGCFPRSFLNRLTPRRGVPLPGRNSGGGKATRGIGLLVEGVYPVGREGISSKEARGVSCKDGRDAVLGGMPGDMVGTVDAEHLRAKESLCNK